MISLSWHLLVEAEGEGRTNLLMERCQAVSLEGYFRSLKDRLVLRFFSFTNFDNCLFMEVKRLFINDLSKRFLAKIILKFELIFPIF